MTLATADYSAEITASTCAIADLVEGADLSRPIPTCPDWTLRQLATHVGRGQRWAAEIVSTRSHEFIPFRAVPDGRFPDDPSAHRAWLRDGASRLIEEVRAAGDAPVWAFGPLAPARFWARRMAHETAVHRADAQIAAGIRPELGAAVAADGIDEWLTFMSAPRPGQPDPRAAALAGGRSLHLHATDSGLDPPGEWVLSAATGPVTVTRGHAKADTAVRGPAAALLLVLVRRIPAQDSAVEVVGDRELLAGWLAATPF